MRPRLAALVPLLASLGLAETGCVEIIEANIQAVDTLADDDASSRDKGFATAVVAGTLSVAVGLGVAATVAATTDWTPDDPPPADFLSTELGWGLETHGDEVSWFRCTSRIFCTEERVTVEAKHVISTDTVGRTIPFAMGGGTLPEVDLVRIEVHRTR